MKKLFIAGLGFAALALVPQVAHAGVRVEFRFGSERHHEPARCYSPRMVYSSHHYRPHYPVTYYVPSPAPVMVVRETIVQTPPPQVVIADPIIQTSTRASYAQLGHDWAKDLRSDVATREQFIDYLRENLTKAPLQDYNNFRNTFISAYGVNGTAAFDKAFQEAR